MGIEKCRTATNDSKIKVEDLGKKAVFLNTQRQPFSRTQFDGCVRKGQTAADWIVTKNGVGDVIVELKGKNVDHAIRQVHETAVFWRDIGEAQAQIAGLVVCTQYPRISTGIQRSIQSFARSFRGPVHVVSRNAEFTFENVLSFKGPYNR